MRHLREIRVFALGFSASQLAPPIHPGWERLICAAHGAASVRFGASVTVLEPQVAYWCGDRLPLEVSPRGRLDLRIVYLRGDSRPNGAVAMTPLAHALIERIVGLGWCDDREPTSARLLGVTNDELDALARRSHGTALALPRDARARAIAEFVLASDVVWTATELATHYGCSARTLERLFARETGLGIVAWQRRHRLLVAAAAIAAGRSVTDVALDAGYSGTSAFVHAFARTFGTTPTGKRLSQLR